MIVTMLGTNGWFDTDFGQTMCTLIRTRDYSVILDAGYGIRRIKELVDFSKPVCLLLSHLHLDHTIGLHTLDSFHFQLPVKIVVPAGQKQAFTELVRPPMKPAIAPEKQKINMRMPNTLKPALAAATSSPPTA